MNVLIYQLNEGESLKVRLVGLIYNYKIYSNRG